MQLRVSGLWEHFWSSVNNVIQRSQKKSVSRQLQKDQNVIFESSVGMIYITGFKSIGFLQAKEVECWD